MSMITLYTFKEFFFLKIGKSFNRKINSKKIKILKKIKLEIIIGNKKNFE